MLGASVYVVPFMIQRNVPGIGDWVLPAFGFAAVPAMLAALAYAVLASAMPRAGGSYIYASRGLHPYLGFVASFSQWFGLSIVIGVIAYIIVPFFRDIATAMEWIELAALLDTGVVRVGLALAMIWGFVGVNVMGAKVLRAHADTDDVRDVRTGRHRHRRRAFRSTRQTSRLRSLLEARKPQRAGDCFDRSTSPHF